MVHLLPLHQPPNDDKLPDTESCDSLDYPHKYSPAYFCLLMINREWKYKLGSTGAFIHAVEDLDIGIFHSWI